MKNKAFILTLFMVLLVGLCGNASAYTINDITVLGRNAIGSPVYTGLQLSTGQSFSVNNIRGQFVLSLLEPTSTLFNIIYHPGIGTGIVNPDGTSADAPPNPHFNNIDLTDPVSGKSFHMGTLVGQIGNGTYFEVGKTGVANQLYTGPAGELKLLMWGLPSGSPISIPGHVGMLLESNCGFVKADVSATPIPGAAWLLGSGIIGLIGLKRRKGNKA